MILIYKEITAIYFMINEEERTGMPSLGKKMTDNVIKKQNQKFQKGKAIKKTLRADQNAYINSISLNSFIKSILSKFPKRVSLSVSSFVKTRKGCQGSMTVEASLVFPIFLFTVLNLLCVLDFVYLQSSMTAALHQTGKQLSIYGYAYDKSGLDLEEYPLSQALFSYTFVKTNVENSIGKEYLESTVLKYGSMGVYYGSSKIMEEDRVDLVALYDVTGLFSMKGLKGIPIYSRFYGHIWNGYDVEKTLYTNEDDVYVFITKSGTVYHRNRNCTYLNPSIKAVYYEDIEKKRNEGGGIFYACERCGGEPAVVVYVTEYGNRYHTTMECSGLKRTVYSVRLSETGRPPCSKCGY